ncbi:TIGR02234 family membrane protein [Microbispora sp. RL4-1S]|uniref:TIGR02234 family membrane protein n=1 Tax=Microbispora oryzae TaxID=2806554 RepID=A0A940WBB2_9ACTN|nr:TIGR02234 family membrane protein [Microbispora oryzae]MBP2702289.1 TIGR02234 family membrane protein [Microbispora oryzae]
MAWLATCAAAGALALLAAGRIWATVTFDAQAGPLSAGHVSLTGGDLAAVLTPAVLAALAAGAAVLATRGLARRIVATVISLCGVVVLSGVWRGTRPAAVVAAAREHAATAMVPATGAAEQAMTWVWPLATALGGLVLVAAGAVAAVVGGRWPGMSGRYDRPGTGSGAREADRDGDGAAARRPRRQVGSERALWDAIDEGEDPTAEPRP